MEKAKNEARQRKKLSDEGNDNEIDDVINLKNKAKGSKMKDKSKTKDVKVKKVISIKANKPHMALKQQQTAEEKLRSVAKKKLDEQLSIEDLFESDVRLFTFSL